jgi:outer membrane protein OmpA-like peptidoglycan-associated protein
MKRYFFLVTMSVVLLAVIFSVQSFGQFQSKGVRIGIGGGFLIGSTEKTDDKASEAVRFFLRHNIDDYIDGDLTGTIGGIKATDYQADLWLAEYKLLYKLCPCDPWEPYIGGGFGLGYYFAHHTFRASAFDKSGYVGYIPLTIGVEYALADGIQFDLNGSFNYSLSDVIVTNKRLNSAGGGLNDAWWGIFASLSSTIFSGDNDADNDGLLRSIEEQLGTDPNNADTDGDGLTDGEEVNTYHTNPLKVDSDGDNLPDKDEITVNKTNPNRADTDGDGLSDGDEILKYSTDPLKVDTDGDGLSDGDEVTKTKTDPLKADTDGDGLSDKDEIAQYKTDPLKVDTDGDGISDGLEVKNTTNPLDPNDPKKPEVKQPEAPAPVAFKAEVGKAIVLEGVVFKTGSAIVTSASDEILTSAKKTLEENLEIEVQIQGFTDNVGKPSTNLKLSQKRADAVKAWLVKGGIAASRITAKGFGDKNPIGDNSTPEGRQKNRRIEFFRTK